MSTFIVTLFDENDKPLGFTTTKGFFMGNGEIHPQGTVSINVTREGLANHVRLFWQEAGVTIRCKDNKNKPYAHLGNSVTLIWEGPMATMRDAYNEVSS